MVCVSSDSKGRTIYLQWTSKSEQKIVLSALCVQFLIRISVAEQMSCVIKSEVIRFTVLHYDVLNCMTFLCNALLVLYHFVLFIEYDTGG